MVYDVYASGFKAVQATLTIDLNTPKAYSLNLHARTQGVLGKIVPWTGTFSSNGWRTQNDALTVKQHESIGTWKGETEVKTYSYNQNKTFKSLVIKDHDKPAETKTVKPELTDGTTDVLTATLNVLNTIASGQSCDSSAEIFDGKRRFQQIFKHQKNEPLAKTRYNIYEGQTQRCTVEVKPIAGKWHDKPRGWLSIQEQGRNKGTIPTVWMATITEGQPAVPVKVMVKTNYGAFVMHLAEYKNGEDVRIAEKRIKYEQK